ncbi:MAG: hypothetical protein ACRET5_07145 [Steroidobacteraceae bacterium]
MTTTTHELSPVSVTGGTSNEAETTLLPVAMPMALKPWMRA